MRNWLLILLLLSTIQLHAAAPAGGPLFLNSDGTIFPGGDARFPTSSQVGAMTGTSGTPPSGGNKFVDNADNRLSGMFTPTALSNSSQINPTNKPTQYIQGSSSPVVLTNAKWIMDGTFVGQRISLRGSHPSFTVTGPTTATIKNCGGVGDVVIGSVQETPDYTWLGTLWARDNCQTIQQALNAGPKLLWGFTAASPFQLRGDGGAGLPSTTGVNGYDDGAGSWIWECTSSGGSCNPKFIVPAGRLGSFVSGSTTLATIDETVNAWNFINGHQHLRGGTGAPTAGDCDASGEARRVWIQTDAADAQMLWLCKGASGWKQQIGGGGVTDRSVRVLRTSSQTLTNDTDVPISFPDAGESYDTDSMHEGTTNPTRITFTTAGKYMGGCVGRFAASTLGTYRSASVRKNGITKIFDWAATFATDAFPNATIIANVSVHGYNFAANDYVEFLMGQNSGSDLISEQQADRFPSCAFQKVN